MGKPDLLEVTDLTNDKFKPAIDSQDLLDAQKHPKEVKEMGKELYRGDKVKGVSEKADAGQSPKERVEAARSKVESEYTDITDAIRDAAGEAVTKKSDPNDPLEVAKRNLIATAPIEKAFAILMAQKNGKAKLVEISKTLASQIEPYKSMSADPYIDAAQVLRADMAKRFDEIAKVKEAAEKEVNDKLTGVLQKRFETTQALNNARDGANELHMSGKAGTVDLTAATQNQEGTVHATKWFESMVGKTNKELSSRTFRDPETKAYLREVVFAVEHKNPTTGRMEQSDNEAVVEVWNVGKQGGNLVRSSFVKVDTKTNRQWTYKRGSRKWGFLPKRVDVERPASVLQTRSDKPWHSKWRPKTNLSPEARQELDGINPNDLESSMRSYDSEGGGSIDSYALTTKHGARHAKELGLKGKQAKKITKSPGFISMLSARLFSNSEKISKKG